MVDTNPYDMLVQSDTATNLRLSMMDSVDKSPDVEAKLQGLAKQYGMPVDAVRFQKPEIERKAKLDSFDYESLAQNYPKTSATLGKPENAAIAHDDVTVMTALEDAAKYFTSAPAAPRGGLSADVGRVGGAVASAIPSANSGLWGAMAAPFELVGIDSVGGWMRGQQKTAKRTADSWMGLDRKASLVERGVMSGFQSAGQNLLLLPIGLAGSSSAMLSAMGVITGGQSYGKGRDAGLLPSKALALGIEDGVAEVVTEKFMGAAGFLKNVKAGATAGKLFGYEVLKEVPGEIGATVWQNFNSWANINPDKPIAEFIKEQPEAIAETIIATLVGGGAQIGAVRGIDRMMRPDQKEQFAQKSEQHAQVLETLQKTAEASKLVSRSPDTLSTYMQSLADEGAPNIYLDSSKLVEAGVDLNALARAVPSLASQLDQVETGGDLVIPTGELLTNTLGSRYAQAIVDHARTDVNGMSRTEAKAYMETQSDTLNAEIERVLAEKSNDETFKASRDVVQTRLEGELQAVNRFTPAVNKQYASLAANFYAVMAARAGVTTEQFADTYTLGFTGNMADSGQVLNQSAPETPEFKNWFGDSKVVDSEGKPLVVYHGTVKDFDAFDNSKTGSNDRGLWGRGHYFAANPDTANSYALRQGEGARVLPSFVSIKNPFILTTGSDLVTRLPDGTNHKELVGENLDGAQIKDIALAGGHDGVIQIRPNGMIGDIVAFNPEQIKSATGNNGNYDPTNPSILEQAARGQIAFANDITQQASIMSLLKGADLSTFIHEGGHFFLEVQADLAGKIAENPNATASELSILDDMNTTLAWMGVTATPELSALDNWHAMTLDEKRPYHEKFARGFEAYAFEGKAPSLELQKTFQTFRAWLVNVYRAMLKSVNAGKTDIAGALDVELNDDVRSVMDRMLATSDQIAEAEAARNMGALFGSAEAGGMTAEQYKEYHDLGMQASMDATDELQARGLKDMQWLSRAKSKKLKELQKRNDALRNAIARDVRAEVMSQPIYRAWTFLTAKGGDKVKGEKPKGQSKGVNAEVDNLFTAIGKLGGLDREAVQKAWGIDPKEKLESGVFGSPVVRKTGGMSLDAMAELLMQEGYLLPDENGRVDDAKFEELFDDQRRGTDRYSISHDMAAAYGEAPLEVPDLPEMGAGKLRTEDLRYMYGVQDDAIWRTLSERRMTSDESGLHPDVVAEMFEFSSGDEMVRKLMEAQPPPSIIADMTDSRMLQEHGDLSTPAGLERAADQAIHNEARAKFIATELKMMQVAMSVREGVEGAKHTVDVLKTAAKEYATAAIAKLKLRDIRPYQYAAAEVRSAKAAVKAGNDLEQATLHKRNQLINNYATKIAYAAQDEVKAAVEYFKKFDKVSKAIDPEYSEQIHALLERFDLRAATTLKAIDKRKSLVDWVASQVEAGLEPNIPAELLQEANRKSFKDMTVEEVRGLRDSIKQIEHLGRLKNKLLTSQANRDFHAAVGEIVLSINENAGDRQADTRTPNTVLGSKLVSLKNFWASHIKAATYARIMDGGKDGGAVWEYLIRSANVAGDTEVAMREKATKELAALVAPVLAEGKMGGKGKFYPSIDRSLNKEAQLAIALNVGNESNLQRLLGGESWSLDQIQPILNDLTQADWTFVQAVWNHFEGYRPAIGAKEKRVYGIEPAWIDAVPVNTPFGQLRGGYFPVKYDPRASERAESHAEAEDAKRMLAGAYTSATTRRSFTKARVDEVKGRPLLLSLDGIYNGVQEVIHDLTWHEWLIDANKLVKNKSIAASMREKYGPDVHQQFKKWLEDNAAGDRGAQGAGEIAGAWVRQGVSISGLGFNVMSAAIQPLGLTQSISRIGVKWVGRGVSKFIGSPLQTIDEINGKSEFMRTRALTRLREINEVRSQVKGRSKPREVIDTGAYFLMMRAQQTVDVPTWWGAYEKAISEGNDEARAVALSDQAVIDSQGSGGIKDQSAIERGSPLQKFFTTFYSFFNTALNLGVQKTMNSDSKAKLAADYLLLYSVPVVLAAALKDALTAGDSGDWNDPDKLLKKLIGEHISYLFGLMMGVRELTGAVQAATNTSQYGSDYSGPAGLRMLADFTKLGKQVGQGELDDSLRKSIINVSGELLRLPAAQVNRTITGINALNEGKTQNPAAVITGYQDPH